MKADARPKAPLVLAALAAGGAAEPPEAAGELCSRARDCATCPLGALRDPARSDHPSSPRSIAVDGEHLYVISEDGLWRVPKRGGEFTRMHHLGGNPVRLDGTHVYWSTTDAAGWRIWAVPKAGGAAREILAGSGVRRMGGLYLDGTHVYTHAADARTLLRARKDGSGREVFVGVPASHLVGSVVVDPPWAYWVAAAEPGGAESQDEIRRTPLAGGPSVTLHRGRRLGLGLFAADGTHLYFTDGGFERIVRITRTGATPQTVATGGLQRLSLDGDHIYSVWRDVTRMPKSGGAWSLIATSREWDENPVVVAFDETMVYWHPDRLHYACK